MLNAHEDGILNDFNVRRSNGLGGLQRFRHRRGLQPATPERHQPSGAKTVLTHVGLTSEFRIKGQLGAA